MVPVLRFYRAEALRYGARQALDEFASDRNRRTSDLLERAERDLIHATSLAPSLASAWADLAHALELRAFTDRNRVVELAGPAVRAANRATELGREVPEFWIRLGVALDMQGRRVDAQTAFEKSVRLAPRNGHAWYYYAHHLSLDTNRRDEALRAIANCLSLDPGNPAAEALR
jgi:tetratricopeptide (TPR) repeat protein